MLLLGLMLFLVFALSLPACSTQNSHNVDEFKIVALEDGQIEFWSDSGILLTTITGYKINDYLQTLRGDVIALAAEDNTKTITVSYQTSDERLEIEGVFELHPKGVLSIHYNIDYPDEDIPLGGGILWDVEQNGVLDGTLNKIGKWITAKHGGAPYEVIDGYCRFWEWGEYRMFVITDGGNEDYMSESYWVCPPEKNDDNRLIAHLDLVVSTQELLPEEAVAIRNRKPVALKLISDQVYNIWETNEEPIPLRYQISNVTDTSQSVNISYWARDFNGLLIGYKDYTIDMAPLEKRIEEAFFNAPWNRGIMFVEIRLKAGDSEQFTRTTLSVLPPYKFKETSDSIFGIAAYWPQPSEKQVLQLMQRLGIRWIRYGDNAVLNPYGISAMYHISFLFERYKGDTEARREFLRKNIRTAKSQKNDYIELGNEFNFVGGIGSGAAAREYVDEWLTPFLDLMDEEGYTAKVLCCGIGGPDIPFMQKLYESGGWDLCDIISLHPARGNYTPDYAPVDNGDFWTYLGSIHRVKNALAELGEKPIWITEAYACTLPNNWWTDSQRNAAENTFLTMALGIAEGIERVFWYQLNDGVWYDKNGINPNDMEYHFGLLNRDLSLKASAIAYRTAAETLDQAVFSHKMKFDDPFNKGLMFETPEGMLAVLWSRADGYVLTQNTEDYVSPEPWVSTWHTRTAVKLPVVNENSDVRIMDVIGKESTIRAMGSVVEVILDGAPVIVYGLSPEAGK